MGTPRTPNVPDEKGPRGITVYQISQGIYSGVSAALQGRPSSQIKRLNPVEPIPSHGVKGLRADSGMLFYKPFELGHTDAEPCFIQPPEPVLGYEAIHQASLAAIDL